MWRSAFARYAARDFINGKACRISKAALSNPLKPVPQAPNSSTWVCFFPQISGFCNYPRFFSQQISVSTDESPNREDSMHSSSVGIDEYHNTQMSNDALMDGHPESFEGSLEENSGEQIDTCVEMETREEAVYDFDVEKLENVLSLLQSSSDGSLESSLDDMDLALHEEFVIKVIEAPLVLGENLIRFFKWAWKEKSFKVTTRVVESLVLSVCSGLRKKEIYSLWDLVKEISEKESGLLNVEILNELMTSFSKLGKGKVALELFNNFEEFGCVPNADSYYLTIEALCRRSFFDWAGSVCQKMLDAKSLPDGQKVGKLISWFCKGKKAIDAHAVYVAAVEENQRPPMSAINFLIGKLCQENETVQIALEMLNNVPREVKKHAIKPFSAVVRSLCRNKDVDAARQLILKMITEGPPPGSAVFNSVITGYSKVGEMEQAMDMMNLMENRGLKPDVYTYTVVMSGYSSGGDMEGAWKVFTEAKRKHSVLSPVTYHTLIRGYCKLEQFDKALELLAEMKDFGVRAPVDEYEKLIQSLCLKALDWERAEKLHEEMKENGLYLKGITRALIRAVKEMENEVLET